MLKQGVAANVPFNFDVQNVRMAAGHYAVVPLSTASGLIQLQNRETGKSILVIAPISLSTYTSKKAESGMIIFHRYGNRYFFSEVWTPNGLRCRTKPSKVEREMEAGTGKQVASVSIPLAAGQ
jgi:hypothetical protein